MQALDIIRTEHQGMWRLASAIDALCQDMRQQNSRAEAATLIAMLDYIDSYTDRVHHPKEDNYLFRHLRSKSPEAETLITRLERQHQQEPEHLQRLKQWAQDIEAGRAPLAQDFFDTVAHFTEMMREHIRLEETTVMPLAREKLTADDWQEIDAAFLKNEDPLFGGQVRAEFEALKARLVHLAPEPIGLGGQAFDIAAPVETTTPRQKVLEVRGLTGHYGRIQALHGIDLDVQEGQLVALVGANGAGKTTLLRTISGVQPATAGAIRFYGDDITRISPEKRVRMGICQVPEGRQVFGPMAIEDNLKLGAYTRNKDAVADDMERMYALFPILKEKRRLPAGTLSGGQQQMLAMARALMGKPRLLLLDEPSMGLAPLLVEEVFRVVKQLKSQGITIFLVEQNAHAALAIADIGYVIETGQIQMSGPGPELLQNEEVKRAYLGM